LGTRDCFLSPSMSSPQGPFVQGQKSPHVLRPWDGVGAPQYICHKGASPCSKPGRLLQTICGTCNIGVLLVVGVTLYNECGDIGCQNWLILFMLAWRVTGPIFDSCLSWDSECGNSICIIAHGCICWRTVCSLTNVRMSHR
jgi:hypothetical protein